MKKITREMVINELNNRGYNAKEEKVNKNSVEFNAIMIKMDGNISSLIYPDEQIEAANNNEITFDDVVNGIIESYEKVKSKNIGFKKFFDKDFILENIYIGLQKKSNEDIVKITNEFEIEAYLFIRATDTDGTLSTVTVKPGLLREASVDKNEAWDRARKNTFAETEIIPMVKYMCELTGMKYTNETEEMFAMNPPVYILTNKGKYRGASAFLNKKALREICDKNNTTKLVAIPSSIHEFLIQPYDESLGISIDEFSKMVMEVNTLTVDPVDQLASRAFIINKEDL